MSDKVVLAYSGGLDTSVAIKWLADKYDMEVIALTADIGGVGDLPAIQQKALKVGAVKALTLDTKELFVDSFVFPALQADALYEGQYPLATALGRPLMAKLLVDAARSEGAIAVAHGSTGKGNDQVRFDVSIVALAPELRIVAPAREWGMTREETIAYAEGQSVEFWRTHGLSLRRRFLPGRNLLQQLLMYLTMQRLVLKKESQLALMVRNWMVLPLFSSLMS